MKEILLKITFLLVASIFFIHASAQNRSRNNYYSDYGIPFHQLQKNSPSIFLSVALSGYYFEGFENTFPPAGWQVIDVFDTTYKWTTSLSADYPSAYQGQQSAYCHYTFPAGIDGEDWLISPQFTVSPTDSLFFQFKLEYFGFAPDSTFILISTTDSALSSFTTVLDYYAEGLNYPTDSSNWYLKNYSLAAYAGQSIYVAFKNKNNFGNGVFIDNVELGTRPAAEVSAISIDMDDFYPAGNSTPQATVNNNGGSTQTFNVTMNITGGYTSTKSVTVTPQTTAQINFDPWNAGVGNYTINVQTFLTGDANSSNDTISKTIKVLETFVNYGWSTHDPLIAVKQGATAVSVCSNSNSRYFEIGGMDVNAAIVPDASEYDLSFSTWASINPMPNGVWKSASTVANGIVIITGGEDATGVTGNTQIYNYNTDTWSNGTPMPIPVSNAAFATYKDSLLYVIAGKLANQTFIASVQIYNSYTDSWTTATSKPGNGVAGARAGIVGNKIVVTGGFDFVANTTVNATYVGVIDSINPTQIAWTQVADFPLNQIRFSGSAVSLDKNSTLVVFSGGTKSDTYGDLTNRTFAFDFSSNSWKLGPNKPTAAHYFYMTPVLQNDSLYLAALGGGSAQVLFDNNEWLNLGYYQIPTGILENNFVTEANLFPNPASDVTILSLNLKNTAHLNISITDLIGNVVMKVCDKKMNAGKNAVLIQTKMLSSGMYLCVMNIDGKSITKKIIKN